MKHSTYKLTWFFAFGFIVLLVMVFFLPLRHGRIPIPVDALVGLYHPFRDYFQNEFSRGVPFENYLVTDPVRQQIPWRKEAVTAMVQGNMPYWNHYSLAGMPLLGNIQTAALYPLNIVLAVMPFWLGWILLIIIQPLLSGILQYIFLRSKQRSSLAALFGGISWSFSGVAVAWLLWGTIGHVTLWLPLLLLCTDKIGQHGMTKGAIRWLWIYVLVCGMGFLAGHTQIWLYTILVSLFYGCGVVYFTPKIKTTVVRLSRWKTSFLLIASGLLGFLVFIQASQFFRTFAISSRSIGSETVGKEGWLIPAQHLLQFLAPDFFGNPATLNYFGVWNYGEMIGYVGIIGLLFAFLGIAVRIKSTWFWTFICCISLVLAIDTPITRWLYSLELPIYSSLQPTRLLVVTTYAMSVLMAYGVDSFRRIQRISVLLCITIFWISPVVILQVGYRLAKIYVNAEQLMVIYRNMIIPTGIIMVSFGWLFGVIVILLMLKKKKRSLEPILLLTVIVFLLLQSVDLLRFGQKFTPFAPKQFFYPKTSTIEYLKDLSPVSERVAILDDRILAPNICVYYGIPCLSAYDPLVSERYEQLIAAIERGKPDIQKPFGFNRILTPKNISSPLFGLLQATHAVSLSPLDPSIAALVHEEGETKIYALRNALPRVYFVESIIKENNDQNVITQLYNSEFNFRDQAVVSTEDVIPPFTGTVALDTITLTSMDSMRMRLESNTFTDRFVVLLSFYSPFWKAYISGKSIPTYRVNFAFTGFVVPAGTHVIEFNYE